MVAINKTSSLLIVLAILITYPFAISFLPFSYNKPNFSTYNTDWNGASKFREMFEEAGANVSTIVGSSNILSRINASETPDGSLGTVVILGPSIHYDFTESLAIVIYAINGGRVLIADDFGTANDILSVLSIFLDAFSQVPMPGMDTVNLFGMEMSNTSSSSSTNTSSEESYPFPIAGIAINGTLLIDQQRYLTNPTRPIFTGAYTGGSEGSYQVAAPLSSELLSGISNGVLGNFASIITMKVRYPNQTRDENGNRIPTDELVYVTKWVPFGEFPASASSAYSEAFQGYNVPDVSVSVQIGVLYSSSEAWLETDIETAKNNVNDIEPNTYEWGNPNAGFPVFISFPLPMGGSLMICSDPSIFINQYLDPDSYYDAGDPDLSNVKNLDNYQFAHNVIQSLMSERPGQMVIFDESHLANHPLSPIFPLSLYFKFLDMMTMFPLLAIFVTPTAIVMAKKFIPKREAAKPLLITKVQKYYGRSFFAVKMRWFLEYRRFGRGLELIYRRVKRTFVRRYNPGTDPTPELFAQFLSQEYPDRFNYKEVVKRLTELEDEVISQKIEITEEEFMSYYLFLKEISEVLG